jgi:hypothetical protein
MIYREPGFLLVVCISCSSIPPPLPSESSTDDTQEDCGRDTEEEGGWVGGGAKSTYDGEKAWFSIINSILSAQARSSQNIRDQID